MVFFSSLKKNRLRIVSVNERVEKTARTTLLYRTFCIYLIWKKLF